ncbi:MAG: hypothetical protein ACLQDY_27430 [Streptosporangiaceae bacterium]
MADPDAGEAMRGRRGPADPAGQRRRPGGLQQAFEDPAFPQYPQDAAGDSVEAPGEDYDLGRGRAGPPRGRAAAGWPDSADQPGWSDEFADDGRPGPDADAQWPEAGPDDGWPEPEPDDWAEPDADAQWPEIDEPDEWSAQDAEQQDTGPQDTGPQDTDQLSAESQAGSDWARPTAPVRPRADHHRVRRSAGPASPADRQPRRPAAGAASDQSTPEMPGGASGRPDRCPQPEQLLPAPGESARGRRATQAAAPRMPSSRTAAGRAGSDRAGSDGAGSDRAATSRAANGRVPASRAAADRGAAGQGAPTRPTARRADRGAGQAGGRPDRAAAHVEGPSSAQPRSGTPERHPGRSAVGPRPDLAPGARPAGPEGQPRRGMAKPRPAASQPDQTGPEYARPGIPQQDQGSRPHARPGTRHEPAQPGRARIRATSPRAARTPAQAPAPTDYCAPAEYPPPADWVASADWEPQPQWPVQQQWPPGPTAEPAWPAEDPSWPREDPQWPGEPAPDADDERAAGPRQRTSRLISEGRASSYRPRSAVRRRAALALAAVATIGTIAVGLLSRDSPSWPPSVAQVTSEANQACQNQDVRSEPGQVNFACARSTRQVLWVFALLTSRDNARYANRQSGRVGLEPIRPAQGGIVAWSLNLHHPYNPRNPIDSLQVAARAINNIIGGATVTSTAGRTVIEPGLESTAADCLRYTGSARLRARSGFPALCARPVTSPAGQAALVADVFRRWIVDATPAVARDAGVLFENAANPGALPVQAILRGLRRQAPAG